MSTSTLIAVLAAAVAVGAGSTSAVRAAQPDPITVTVSSQDLDLSTPDGAKAMLGRIDQAAREVCQPDADIAALPGMGDWNRICVSTRVRDAVGHLNAPLVTAAYSGKPQVSLAERDSH